MRFFQILLVAFAMILASQNIFASITSSIEVATDHSLQENQVILYSSNGFRGNYVQVKLGFITPDKLKEFKVYTIRSVKVAPKTKLHIHYLDKNKETIYRSKEKTEIKKFTRLQVAEYGDFEDPVANVLADPNSKIKGIVYNSLRTKNLTITPGKIDAHQFAEKGMNFFKSYELAPGYEMTAFAFTGFKGESQVVRGKGTLNRLCKSLYLRKINGKSTSAIEVLEEIPSDDIYAVLKYNVTKKQVKIKPGNYDHNQLKSAGIRFVQAAQIPAGYELWAYPFSGFRGDPVIVTSSGKLKKMAMSVKLKKR